MEMMHQPLVELVDTKGQPVGTAPKLDVHLDGRLHRAISVFVFDDKGNELLQQRAGHKYHAPGLWSNAVCSHPHPGECPRAAAHRRLEEELSLQAALCEVFIMRYRADVGEGLVEHEYDHVFVARALSEPRPNPEEVQSIRWMPKDTVGQMVREQPKLFTPWFKLAHDEVLFSLQESHGQHAKVLITPRGDKATFLFPEEVVVAA